MSKLFSKTAMERIASPEQLDQQVRIVRPYHWIGILAVLLLVTGVTIWAVFGNINSTVELQGLVFPKAGAEQIFCQNQGTVSNVLYGIGDAVQKGDIIAVIPDEALLKEIEAKKEAIADVKVQQETAAQQEETAALQQELERLYADYEDHSIIRATNDGTIHSIVSSGELLEQGDQVANILVDSQYSNNRQIAAYVPLTVAKRLEAGMEVQICPSYISREEYGYMEGYISSIGEVPVTEESLRKYYGNLEYVADILPSQSCVEILIGIQMDEDSENHFRWSNEKGEKVAVEAGTVCDIQAVVEKEKPFHLFF